MCTCPDGLRLGSAETTATRPGQSPVRRGAERPAGGRIGHRLASAALRPRAWGGKAKPPAQRCMLTSLRLCCVSEMPTGRLALPDARLPTLILATSAGAAS